MMSIELPKNCVSYNKIWYLFANYDIITLMSEIYIKMITLYHKTFSWSYTKSNSVESTFVMYKL